MIFVIILVFLSFLAYQYDIKGKGAKRNRDIWYKIILWVLILVAGLRYRLGGDSIPYLYCFYNRIPYLWEFQLEDIFKHQYEPLFLLFNIIIKSLVGKFFIVQIIHASIVNILIFKYFKKHSRFPFLCVLIYFIWMYILFNFEVMRASLSVVICLFASDFILEKKWLKGYALYILAIGFHYSALVMLVIPFLFKLRINKIGYLILFASFVAGFWIASRLNNYLFLFELTDSTTTSDKVDLYMSNGDLSNGVDLRGYLLHVIPALLYPIITFKIIKRKKEPGAERLLKLEPLIMIGLMFELITNSILMLYRVAYFFVIYLIICYSELVIHIIRTTGTRDIQFAIVKVFIFLLPFINIITSYYRAVENPKQSPAIYNYRKYVPYSSIIDKTKDPVREKIWGYNFPTSPEEY